MKTVETILGILNGVSSRAGDVRYILSGVLGGSAAGARSQGSAADALTTLCSHAAALVLTFSTAFSQLQERVKSLL